MPANVKCPPRCDCWKHSKRYSEIARARVQGRRGSDHPAWRGDKISSYRAVHTRLAKLKTLTAVAAHACGRTESALIHGRGTHTSPGGLPFSINVDDAAMLLQLDPGDELVLKRMPPPVGAEPEYIISRRVPEVS